MKGCGRDRDKVGQRKQTRAIFRTLISYLVLITIAILMFLPFAWMISSSLKDPGVIFLLPPQWIPRPFRFDNYAEVWQLIPFLVLLYNSFKISLLAVVGGLFSCSLAAYAFARLRFPGRDVIFTLVLITLMVPPQVTMIPVFMLMRRIGWVDNHLALIVPTFLGGAFGTFLLRQFFMNIPGELEEAAKIDGCSIPGIYFRIFLPLSKPALTTLAVFIFLYRWNDLLLPLIYLRTFEKMTLTVGLSLFQGLYSANWTALMASAVISMIPTVILYLAGQSYFEKGIAMTGIKG
ncbi:MAG: carbohydrate ABC transporter permease [Firmicutes bacterium]|nr:carbohydrate ABC transporter permease [Bacillota bacterium]